MSRPRPAAAAPPGQVRIIGGRWRSRRLVVPALPGLRPTPDRVRETLFNWLAPRIAGAWCLDLFAGTGALGFEALSRGAAGALLVERDHAAAAALREQARLLGAEQAEVVLADAREFLSRPPPRAFDVVFLDPPYQSGLVPPCLGSLSQAWLRPGVRVYVETAADAVPTLPSGLHWLKHGRAGQVGYHLAALASEAPTA